MIKALPYLKRNDYEGHYSLVNGRTNFCYYFALSFYFLAPQQNFSQPQHNTRLKATCFSLIEIGGFFRRTYAHLKLKQT